MASAGVQESRVESIAPSVDDGNPDGCVTFDKAVLASDRMNVRVVRMDHRMQDCSNLTVQVKSCMEVLNIGCNRS